MSAKRQRHTLDFSHTPDVVGNSLVTPLLARKTSRRRGIFLIRKIRSSPGGCALKLELLCQPLESALIAERRCVACTSDTA